MKTRIAILTCLLLIASVGVADAASNKASVSKATKWIGKTSLTQFPGTGFRADAVSALAAARQIGAGGKASRQDRFVSYLEENVSNYATGAGPTAKLILAAVAAKKNPRCFGVPDQRSDLYVVLSGDYAASGKFGTTAFDHALAILALKAAHERIPSAAVKYAKKQRGKHGWNFPLSKSAGDDVESTALMIEALRGAGVSKNDSALKQAYKWLTFQRNQQGGFNPSAAAGETQANTTAYAIRAADALGKDNSKAKRALRALQEKSGFFRSTPATKGDYPGIATSDSVIALSGAHYPVVTRKKKATSCV